MQLEKATSTAEQAGLAGWISSNDVTLFTVVVMLVIAMVLQAHLSMRTGENKRLSQQSEARIADLSTTLSRHDASLAALEKRHAVLIEQRETLRSRLSQTTAALASLEQNLAELQTAHDKLAEERLAMEQARVALKQAKDAELADLAARLDLTAQKIVELVKERDLLKSLADSLRTRLRTLEAELGENENTLAAARQRSAQLDEEKLQLDETIKLLRQAVAQSDEQQRAAAARVNEVQESERLLQLQIDALQAQLKNFLARAQDAEKQLEQYKSDSTRVNRSLVGLAGPLRRVAVLVDCSGSMAQQEGGWENVRTIVMTWLEYLEVDRCVLIMFADEAAAFPADGSLLAVRGPGAAENRKQLIDHLAQRVPGGWTNTVAAFEAAYAYQDIDTIVLFTDGQPTNIQSSELNRDAIQQIYALSAKHKNIPINAIGVGDYFADPELSKFLRRLAGISGGTFLGR